MALSPSGLKSNMSTRIFNSLKREFADVESTPGYSAIADAQWQKIANALSDVAMDIVTEITSNGEVNPGIPVTGGNATTAPGTIS